MHATIEQLLSVRDGEPVDAAVRSHVDECCQCSAELDGLEERRRQLRALRPVAPPPEAWRRLATRLDEGEHRRRRPWTPSWWATGLAAAAALATVLLLNDGTTPVPQAVPEPGPVPLPVAVTADEQLRLEELVARSRELEARLRSLRQQSPQVIDARTAGTIAGLQDGIALLDYRMSMDPGESLSTDESAELWQRRVGLMNTLVQVRGAQLQRAGYELQGEDP